MKLLIAGTLTANLFLVTAPIFAQTAPSHDKTELKAEHKAQWKECMQRMEAQNKGLQKSEGEHQGSGKAKPTSASGEKKPTGASGENKGTEKGTASAGEAKKMNRHEQEMQACRQQLYGGKEPGGEEAKAPKAKS